MDHSSLSFALQLSRWVGVAPYVRTPEYRVSRTIDIIGKIFVTFASAVAALLVIASLFFYEDATLLTVDYLHSGARIMAAVIALIGSYTASERLSRMFRMLKQLNQIDTNLPCKRIPHSDWAMYILMCSTLLYTIGVPITTFTLNTNKDNSIIFWEILSKISRALMYQIVTLIEMQMITFAGRVLQTLTTVNQSLELLIPVEDSILATPDTKKIARRNAWENTGTFKIDVKPKTTLDYNRKNVENKSDTANAYDANTLRQLAKYIFNICKIVRTITEGDGYLLMMLLVCHTLHVEISWHKTIVWLSSTTELMYLYVIPSILRSVVHSIALIYCTEVFHQTHAEMDRTHQIINYLKCRRCDEEDVNNELELFVRMLLLNKTTYSPLHMCTLSRLLVMKIFGSLVTYLIIILTYGTETKAPELIFENKRTLI
ncbi:unnamed protein product [Euphydryas editha]|uniref:Gustatory receptor n=1 Tax=Euphydryas editha TaxID=104508 RepID=A0AAU9UFY8_EUPED|nr:unnamed protein product [Euphydryas editha]